MRKMFEIFEHFIYICLDLSLGNTIYILTIFLVYNHARVHVCVCGTNIKTLAETFQLLDLVLVIPWVVHLYVKIIQEL